jgi:hypothetical protein
LRLQCALVVLPCMYVSSRHAHDNWQRTAQAEFLGGPLRAMQMEGGARNRSAPEQLVRQTFNLKTVDTPPLRTSLATFSFAQLLGERQQPAVHA